MGLAAVRFVALFVLLVAGCVQQAALGSDCDVDGGCRLPVDAGFGVASLAVVPIGPEPLSGVRSLDVLFVVDASPGALGYQQALADKLPGLVDQLQRGELDGAGFPEFRPLAELRAGVVAANRGVTSSPAAGCEPFDAHALTVRSVAAECMGEHSGLMRSRGLEDTTFGHELACAVQLGESACGVSQPLQAVVEGLAALRAAQGGTWADDSAQLVVILSAQEDCSTDDAALFAPDERLTVGDALRGWPDIQRCIVGSSRLASPASYVVALNALRGKQPERLMLFALAGFPAERVGVDTYVRLAKASATSAERFYGELLGDPRMNHGALVDPSSRLGNACAGTSYTALPARRLAQLTQQLDPSARVGSVCGDFEGALAGLARLVASKVRLAGL